MKKCKCERSAAEAVDAVLCNESKQPVSIYYCLDAVGRKAAFEAGLPAYQTQCVQVYPDDPEYAEAVRLAEVDEDGIAVLDMTHLEWNCIPKVQYLLNAMCYRPVVTLGDLIEMLWE